MKSVHLVLLRGERKGRKFSIEEGSNLIGRWDPDAGAFPEIDLEEYDVDAKISRKHAMITRRGDKLTLEDLGSLNGTFVNRGQRLEQGQLHELNNGDEVVVGKVFLTIEVA